MKPIAIVAALAAAALLAAAPAGFEMWKGSQLRGFTKELAPKVNAQKVATQQLAKFGNHLVMVAHREGDGEAELHETQADVFVVQSGAGTLIVGGTMVNGRNTAPGEVRGPSINGGEKRSLGPGDIVNIPSKIPHQVLVASGQQITYAIVKIDEK
ncbi:MAG TPA: cupin domain-containing protein [Bryobacteraceae bacterium]|nr:cupin domain-containing protein [Bryobacteraceae bacterium]